jgi:uncharacterized protein YdiU (UPF0061 family)
MLKFDNTYARLPEIFHERRTPANRFTPSLLALNHELIRDLGLELGENADHKQSLAECLCGNRLFPGSEPLAMAYAGHQFGHFVPSLGDGRALLLGEFLSADQTRYDLHLKGSGRTRFSRRGDGLSALGPVVREYLLSEAFHALGIPATRSLAALRTGDTVYREGPKPGGVLARVARSHIRIGTFQYFAARGEWEHLRTLADYTIARLYPELVPGPDTGQAPDYLAFWKAVAQRQIERVAQWMSVGFIHGVMNTDNINVSGETIDFGPCAFMDEYNPNQVFSSIDENGRYRYNHQGSVLFWNLARLAECLIPLMYGASEAERGRYTETFSEIFTGIFTEELQKLPAQFERALNARMLKKLGLQEHTPESESLLKQWLDLLERHSVDFTLAHIDLERVLTGLNCFIDLEKLAGFSEFLGRWKALLHAQGSDPGALAPSLALDLMQKHNPLTIPRNHQVEKVISACEQGEDASFFDFLRAIRAPFDRSAIISQAGATAVLAEYQRAPEPHERVTQTFCGT